MKPFKICIVQYYTWLHCGMYVVLTDTTASVMTAIVKYPFNMAICYKNTFSVFISNKIIFHNLISNETIK